MCVKLLSEKQFSQVESRLNLLLDRIFQAEGLSSFNSIIRTYVMAGGKRLRPQLCIWTYQQAAGSRQQAVDEPSLLAACCTLPASLLDIACGWELFHAFLLAHDDIIDNSDRRRDRLSLHRQLASLDGESLTFGTNLCIVAGDLLFSAAMRIWHELDLPGEMYKEQLKLFSRIACTTGYGQAIDICQSHAELDAVEESTLLREYRWKTAAYTFEGPMLSGAILAGVCKAGQDAISRFALELGQAYQLHNDLIDLSHPAEKGGDLEQGKRTPALIRARGLMTDLQRHEFDDRLTQIRTSDQASLIAAEYLRNAMATCGAIEQTCDLIDQSLNAADEATQDPSLSPQLSAAMHELLNSVRSTYFVYKTAGVATR